MIDFRIDVDEMEFFAQELYRRVLKRSEDAVNPLSEIKVAMFAQAKIAVPTQKLDQNGEEGLGDFDSLENAISAANRDLELEIDSFEYHWWVSPSNKPSADSAVADTREFTLTYLFVLTKQPPSPLEETVQRQPNRLV